MVNKIRKAKPQPKQEQKQKTKLSKFIKKKSKNAPLTKRDNTYVFEGFYEKLKQIDVKQSNALETNFMYDSVLRQTDENDEDELFNSNFIQLLRFERANNKTVEFGRVYKVLEPFCFSYPLLVLNKSKVINLMLNFLNPESAKMIISDNHLLVSQEVINSVLLDGQPIFAIQIIVLDLMIALIKDFRSEIYQDFVKSILPAVISVIDMQKVQILDKVFMTISFGVKYLSKSIKEDIRNFYSTYSELLVHKNRYLRKFASQSLSYVLRKIPFNQNTIQMATQLIYKDEKGDIEMIDETLLEQDIQSIINDKERLTQILGLSDMLFEVIYGAGEGLHSKYNEVMTALITFYQSKTSDKALQLVLRCLFLKLVNEVDTEKQQPLFDIIDKEFLIMEDENQMNLVLNIQKDSIRLKYGKRLSNYGIINIIQNFNKMLVKQINSTQKYSFHTKINIASTLSLLYYYKHNSVKNILAKSNIDINDSSNLFTSHIYKLVDPSQDKSIEIIEKYLDLVLKTPSEIASFEDLDWSQILALKQSSKNVMEFSQDTHLAKISILIKSVNKQVLKMIQEKESSHQLKTSYLAVFVAMQRQVQQKYEIEINEKVEEALILMIDQQIKLKEDNVGLYTIFRYLSYCKGHQKINQKIEKVIKIYQNTNQVKQETLQLSIRNEIKENIILQNYSLDDDRLSHIDKIVNQLFDTTNLGQKENISKQIIMLNQSYLYQNSNNSTHSESLINSLELYTNDIIALRSFNQCKNIKHTIQENQKLLTLLTDNLLKNQVELRLQTLLILSRFDKLNYLNPKQDDEKNQDISDVYRGDCPIIDLMLQFEQTKIGFETEKTKILLIKKIEALLDTGLVPVVYVEIAFKFLVGCFWIKFTPIFEAVQESIATIIRTYDQNNYKYQMIQLIRDMGLIIQVAHQNQDIENIILKKVNVEVPDDTQNQKNSLIDKCYQRESRLNEDYLEIKDFYFNLTKTLQLTIDNLLQNKTDCSFLFQVFYEFIDCEFMLTQDKKQNDLTSDNQRNLVDRMTYANMIDTEQYRQYKRQTYSKLYCFVELFHRADKLSQISRLQDFQNLMLKLISSSDSKLQKLSLECLIKTDYKGGILRHYRKLLEGLADDEKFKDVIAAVTFGSSKTDAGNNPDYPLTEGDVQKKQDKSAIPKLLEIHRLDVLPVIIKLLLSKLARKKGSINKKSIHVRRNIVFNFMSSLKPGNELNIFVNEILLCFDININKELDLDQIQQKFSQVSFGVFLNFINQFSVVIKQLGSQLKNHLPLFTKVIIGIMNLTKIFSNQIKLNLASVAEESDQEMSDEEKEDQDSEDDNDQEQTTLFDQTQVQNNGDNKESLYRFVAKQSKMCMRKALGVVIQLYQKFNYDYEFVRDISEQFYKYITQDQLDLLDKNYAVDKSQLIEILTIQWSANLNTLQNFLIYEQLLPALLKMLQNQRINPEVYDMHFSLLKTLIQKSVAGLEERKDIFTLASRKRNQARGKAATQEDEEDLEEMEIDQSVKQQEREVSQQILKKYIKEIALSLNIFSQNNLNQLKHTLFVKFQKKQKPAYNIKLGAKPTFHETNQNTLKDLIFIMSEITTYLQSGDQLNQDFLDMTINILSLKPLHSSYSPSSNSTTFNEELLLFGLTKEQIEKILIMFLTLKSLKIRNILSKGLMETVFNENNNFGKELGISNKCIEIICSLNTVKKGLADVELDYDLIIKTIEEIDEQQLKNFSYFEIRAISYSVVFLLQSEEFSVRDYACHFLKKLFDYFTSLISQIDQDTFKKEFLYLITNLESQLVHMIKSTYDELVLKTLLESIRHYVIFLHQHQDIIPSQQNIQSLYALIGVQQDQEDFFTRFLAIKLKSRAKTMQFLIQKLDQGILKDYRAIQAVILPLLNYVIFGGKHQKENRRNTVTYSREERRMTMDEALKAYQAIAKQLKWSDYYKMLKLLVFKLHKTTNKASMFSFTSGKGEDSDKAQERIITKCICKVLNGFNFSEVPDAVDKLNQMQMELEDDGQDQDFEKLLNDLKTSQPITSALNDDELSEDQEDKGEENAIAVSINAEKEINQEAQQQVIEKQSKKALQEDIQKKLYQKVLPILERHLADYEEQDEKMKTDPEKGTGDVTMSHGYGSMRSFVVLSVVRLIRKLPVYQFENQLAKLINNIISKGLRSRLLVHREKARKALLKIIIEVSPRYLSLVFQLMDDLLTRGYQLQTYIFTILFLLQQLQEKKILKTGMISHKILEITSEKVMDELFGELTTDQKHQGIEDQQKNKIREAKGKKAIPIFEIFAQFIDFKKNFFTLIGPILRSLEGNPSIGRIQQCEELLNRISTSLIKNESVKGDQLLMFMYSIIDKGVNMAARIKINDEKSVKRDYGAKVLKEDMFLKTKQEYKELTYKIDMKWTKGNQLIDNKKAEELSGRVMAAFGLMCLKKAMKNKGLILSNEIDAQNLQTANFLDEDINLQVKKGSEEVKEELKAKLDPFVQVLLNAFKTYHSPIVVSTLHILGMIINLGLPSFKLLMKKFLNRLFKLFEQTSTSTSNQDSDFINSLFKCTAELIKTYSTYKDLSEQQLKTLLFVIKQNLNSQGSNNPSQINVFHLLRALVFRRFLSVDLYDIIDKNIQDLLITSLSPSIRSICSSILVTFLLEYPLEETRLTQHFNYLLKNVGTYFDSEGRFQVLEVIERLCQKMPSQIIDNESEKWVFTLMTRLVNEKNKKCKDKVVQVLTKLFLKISSNKTKTIYNTLQMMSPAGSEQVQENPSKRRAITHAKLQLMSVIIDAQPGLLKGKNEVQNIIQNTCWPIIEEAFETIKEQLDTKSQSKQKLKSNDDRGEDDDGFDAEIQNPEMKKFLQNIELIDANRVEDGKQMKMEDDESEDKDSWSPLYYALDNINRLIVKEETKKISLELIKKTQNFFRALILISNNHHTYWIKLMIQKIIKQILQAQILQKETSYRTVFGLKSQEEEQKLILSFLNSLKILPMTKEISELIIQNILSIARLQLGTTSDQTQINEMIQQIFKRVSLIGRKLMLNISYAKERLECILQFFKQALQLFEQLTEGNSKDNLITREVCEPMMQLVYRVYTDDQYLPGTPPKTLSYSIVDYFSQNLEKAFFLKLYNEVKKSISEKRLERKRQHKIMQVSNTAEWEKIKSAKRDKKRDKKKEKKRNEKIMLAFTKT